MKHPAFAEIFRNAPDAGAQGAGAPPPPGAIPGDDGGAPPPGPASTGEGQPPGPDSGSAAAYRPEGLADHFLGSNDRETIDRLHKAVSGFRQEMAKAGELGEVPKDPAEYKIAWGEKMKPYAGALEKDAFFNDKVKAAGIKYGLRDKQLSGFLDTVMSEMIDADMVGPPFDPDAERAALVPGETDPAVRAAKADAIVRDNQAVIEQWKKDGLPDDVATFLLASLDRAAANRLVQFFRGKDGGEARPSTGGIPPGSLTEADLNAREADPRNRVGNPKFDRAYAAETTRLWKQFYGN